MIEESLVGAHQSNGEVERAIQIMQALMRTIAIEVQERDSRRPPDIKPAGQTRSNDIEPMQSRE